MDELLVEETGIAHLEKRIEEKPFGVECFEEPIPFDPLGYGDETKYFDDLTEAELWIERAQKGPRFKYFALYEKVSDIWYLVNDFEHDPEKLASSSNIFDDELPHDQIASRMERRRLRR